MGSGDIDIIQGTKDAFKEKMQKVYTFLTDCIESIDGCKILQKLNFQTNLSEQQSKINTTKDSINGLLGIVYNCEEDMISLDESSSNRLEIEFICFPTKEGSSVEIDGYFSLGRICAEICEINE